MVDLAKLNRLEKAATPGPWSCNTTYNREQIIINALGGRVAGVKLNSDQIDNLQFLLAMRNAFPELIALLEEARRLAQSLIARGGHPILLRPDDVYNARDFLAKLE
jgi:hypothetical protein